MAGDLTSARRLFLAAALPALCLAACTKQDDKTTHAASAPPAATSDPRLLATAKEPQNWLTYNGDYSEKRFSPLDSINTGNIGRLKLAWSLDLDTNRGQEGTPLVVDGVLYTTTAWSKVVAADAATGKKLWEYDPKVPGSYAIHACCDVVNRGAAYSNGHLFFGTIDGRLIALDAKDGHMLWSTQTTDPDKPYSITGAPRVARGKVFIGNSGAEYAVRGYISAYDEQTGKLVWRFYTIPGKPGVKDNAASDESIAKMAQPTWFGDKYYVYGGGGTVWDSIVFDPEMNHLYVGVGNAGPYDRSLRSEGKGDNLFIGSVLALDPDTGKYLWHYQETPGDQWDYTSTQQMTLAELPVNGKPTKVIMHAPKNGFFYVIDRATGKLISADKYAPVNWAERIDMQTGRPVENPKARYDKTGPFVANIGPWGAHSWHPMSYNPGTGLVYIPVQMITGEFKQLPGFNYKPGIMNMGTDFATTLPTDKAGLAAMQEVIIGKLIAYDPVKQKVVWTAMHNSAGNGGVLSTAGGLVFQGVQDRTFKAYDAKSGKELWSFPTQSTVMAGPVSFSVNGAQYIAVMAGNGTAFTLAMPSMNGKPLPQPPGRILVFKLDGQAALPAPTPFTPAPLQKSTETFTDAQIAAGRDLFGNVCAACHGAGGRSQGVLPDLRRSGVIGDASAFRQIVIEGALQDQGMVSFKKYLSPDQAEAIRAYLNSRAKADAVLDAK